MTAEELDIKLIIPYLSYKKIMGYAKICAGEVTGFADVKLDGDSKTFTVGEVYLIEQEATGASVEMSEEMVSAFNLECIKKGKTQLPNLWWHSHSTMETFFSGTDKDTYKETLNNGTWTIALVVNKSQKMFATLTIYTPFVYSFEDIPIEIDFLDAKIPKYLEEEVKKKVKEKAWAWEGWNKGKKGKQKKFWDNTPTEKFIEERPWLGGQDKYDALDDEDFHTTADGTVLYRSGKEPHETSYHRSIRTFCLPKDADKAIEKIKERGLFKTWNEEYNDHVYEDPQTGDIYRDIWAVTRGVDIWQESGGIFIPDKGKN